MAAKKTKRSYLHGSWDQHVKDSAVWEKVAVAAFEQSAVLSKAGKCQDAHASLVEGVYASGEQACSEIGAGGNQGDSHGVTADVQQSRAVARVNFNKYCYVGKRDQPLKRRD